MLAVGEHLLGEVDDQTLRMTTALGGGVGLTQKELCGAFSSGVLLIGALHGRSVPDVDDIKCAQLVSSFRQKFLEDFDSTICQEIRATGYGEEGKKPCSEVVVRTAKVLFDTL